MRIPDVLKIGGHNYRVDYLSHELLANTARAELQKQVITVSSDAVEDKQAEALLHEVVEVIVNCNNLEISHKDITVLSEWLFMVLRDNGLDFASSDIKGTAYKGYYIKSWNPKIQD